VTSFHLFVNCSNYSSTSRPMENSRGFLVVRSLDRPNSNREPVESCLGIVGAVRAMRTTEQQLNGRLQGGSGRPRQPDHWDHWWPLPSTPNWCCCCCCCCQWCQTDPSDTQATVQFLLSLLSQFLCLWRHGVLVWSAKEYFQNCQN